MDVYLVSETVARLLKTKQYPADLDAKFAEGYQKSLKGLTNFIPLWVKIAVSLALGLGTMIGWKRIVVTVGEKIGKAHMTYAQGASAELVAFATIEAADQLGPGKHHAHSLLGHCRYDGCQWLGHPARDGAQHHPGLGAHTAGLRVIGCGAVRRLALFVLHVLGVH